MGKARVTDNLGEGQYDFELIYSDERAQARIAQIQAKLDQIDNVELVKLQADLITAQADVDAQADALDDAIANWVSAGAWAAGTDYTLGDRLRISGFATMLCEQSGRSGGIIPVWPDSHGDTIRENHVNWNMSVEDQLGGSFWSTSTNYSINDKVIAVPNILVEGEPKNIYATATLNGRSGLFTPSWTQTGTVTEGGVIWRREDNAQAIIEASKDLRELAFLRDKAQAALNVVKTRKLALEREKAWIERHLPEQVLKVAGWCADYSDEIEIGTEVETAEVTGFHHGGLTSAGKAADRTVLIRPQEPPEDYPPQVLDPETGQINQLPEVPAGKLRHAVACTASECLYALMVEPGAEKWRPTWRIGVIDSINFQTNTCNVTLLFADAPRYSDLSVQHNINETVILTDVPIRYMTCNSAAFQVGDRVLIEYAGQDRSFPIVRGFESNPRVCPAEIFCLPASAEFPNGEGTPREATLVFVRSNEWAGTANTPTKYGNIDWRGLPPDNYVLSWNGPPSRYFDEFESLFFLESKCFFKKQQITTANAFAGGAVRKIGDDLKIIYVLATQQSAFSSSKQEKVYIADLVEIAGQWQIQNPVALLTLTWTMASGTKYKNRAPWLFNASATRASSVRWSDVSGDEGYRAYHIDVNLTAPSAVLSDVTPGPTRTVVTQYDLIEQFTDSQNWSKNSYTKTTTTDSYIWYDYIGDTPIKGEIRQVTELVDDWLKTQNGWLRTRDTHVETNYTTQVLIDNIVQFSKSCGSSQDTGATTSNGQLGPNTAYASGVVSQGIDFVLQWIDLRSGSHEINHRITSRSYDDVSITSPELWPTSVSSSFNASMTWKVTLLGETEPQSVIKIYADTTSQTPVSEPFVDDDGVSGNNEIHTVDTTITTLPVVCPGIPSFAQAPRNVLYRNPGLYSWYPGRPTTHFWSGPKAAWVYDWHWDYTGVESDHWNGQGSPYGYLLSGGDPVALTGITATNFSFYPIGV